MRATSKRKSRNFTGEIINDFLGEIQHRFYLNLFDKVAESYYFKG
jgi:hypothetical protein